MFIQQFMDQKYTHILDIIVLITFRIYFSVTNARFFFSFYTKISLNKDANDLPQWYGRWVGQVGHVLRTKIPG